MIHGTLETIDGRPALRFERTFPHSVERVWRAVSVPAELAQWFPAAAGWTPAVGETFEAGGAAGEVTEVDPPHRLSWNFAGHVYSFDLAADGDGCRLTFIHVLDDSMPLAQTATGWETYLLRLEPHLNGEHLGEMAAHEQWSEIHETYAGKFGVDPEPGRRFAEKLRASQS